MKPYRTPEVEAFIADIEAAYRKHGMSLTFDDWYGLIINLELPESAIEDLREADVCRGVVMLPEVTTATAPTDSPA